MTFKTPKADNGSSRNIKICSINICGMSKRSQLVLDKYVNDKKIDILFVQETFEGAMFKSLTNMNLHEDLNHQKNKGSAIYTQFGLGFTPLLEISSLSTNIDTVWGLGVIGGKRYIIGNVYMKLDFENGIKELIKMMDAAEILQRKCKAYYME